MNENTASQRFTLASYPQAILHVDADAFFTSVEQALHPELKGQPVVTGKERGIIACASYEAKALGIARGVALWEAEKRCPGLVVLPSDYETYSIYSKRIFNIMRRFTPQVQEHSIDEGFADITGLRRIYRTAYQQIPEQLQRTIRDELGITVSIGLSLTKVLAKRASSYRKPGGLTAVPGHAIHLFLQRTPLHKVWGFGPNTVQLLKKFGLQTAYDYARKPEAWAQRLLGKPGKEIWNELRGHQCYPVETTRKETFLTVSKCKSFTSAIKDEPLLHARMVRNLESACIKLRRYHLEAGALVVALRTWSSVQDAREMRLPRPTAVAQEMLPTAESLFKMLWRPGERYRAIIVLLGRLKDSRVEQQDLFDDRAHRENLRCSGSLVDAVNERYGKHTLSLGGSLSLAALPVNHRDEPPWRKRNLLSGETARKRLNIPRWAIRV